MYLYLNNISSSWRHKPSETRNESWGESSLDRSWYAHFTVRRTGHLKGPPSQGCLGDFGRKGENMKITHTSIIAGKTKVYWKGLTDWWLMLDIIRSRQLMDCSRCLTKLFPLEEKAILRVCKQWWLIGEAPPLVLRDGMPKECLAFVSTWLKIRRKVLWWRLTILGVMKNGDIWQKTKGG